MLGWGLIGTGLSLIDRSLAQPPSVQGRGLADAAAGKSRLIQTGGTPPLSHGSADIGRTSSGGAASHSATLVNWTAPSGGTGTSRTPTVAAGAPKNVVAGSPDPAAPGADANPLADPFVDPLVDAMGQSVRPKPPIRIPNDGLESRKWNDGYGGNNGTSSSGNADTRNGQTSPMPPTTTFNSDGSPKAPLNPSLAHLKAKSGPVTPNPVRPTGGPVQPVIGPIVPSKLPIGPGRAHANLVPIDGNPNSGQWSWAVDTPAGIDPEQQVLTPVDFRQAPALDPLTGRAQSNSGGNATPAGALPSMGNSGSNPVTSVASSVDPQTGTVRLYAGSSIPSYTNHLSNPAEQGPSVPSVSSLGFDAAATNPVPALVYASNTISVQPIIQVAVRTATDSSQYLPTAYVKATLTWGSTQEPTVTFNTPGNYGDNIVMDFQVPTPITATGAYGWNVWVDPYDANNHLQSNPDIDPSGTLAVVANGSGSNVGYGWQLGVDQLVPVTNVGVTWVYGNGGTRLFTGAGPTYTSPANDFGTLVKNGDNTFTYTAKDQTKWNFNTSGQLSTVVDAHNLTLTYTYASGNLSMITEPNGDVTSFAYSSGKLSTITKPGNLVTTLTRNGSGDLTQIANADGSLVTMAYDGSHRLTSQQLGQLTTTYAYDPTYGVLNNTTADGTALPVSAGDVQGFITSTAILSANVQGVIDDGLGKVTSYTMDPARRFVQVQTPDGANPMWARNSAGLVTTATDMLGQATTMAYSATGGDLTSITRPDNSTATYAYDSTYHKVTTVKDSLNHVTSYGYNTSGDLITITNALNQVTTIAWSNGLEQSVTDPLGHTLTYVYDTSRHLTATVDALGDRTTFGYDGARNIVTVKDPLGHTTSYAYDGLARVTQKTDAAGGVATMVYNPQGQVTSQTDQLGHVTQYTYNSTGSETAKTEAYGTSLQRTTTMAYDSDGRMIAKTDALNHTTSYGYDAVGRLKTITNAAGGVETFAYDAIGRLTADIDPLNHTTNYGYNSRSWPTSVTDPLNHAATTVYDTEGNVTAKVDPLGNRTTYAYDAVNRPIQVTDALNHLATTVYDAAGNVQATVDQLGNRTSYAYDAANRRITATDALSHTLTTVYDVAGNVVQTQDALGNTTSMAYDALNRQISTQDPGGGIATTIYDAVGNVTAKVDPMGDRTTFTLDALNRQTVVKDALTGLTTTAYDAANNVVSITDPVGNTTSMAYDALNRLTQQTDPLNHSATFAYDAASRMTSTTDRNGNRRDFSYDNANRKTGETWIVSGSMANLLTFTYDNGGNQLTAASYGGTYTMTYDALNRMATDIEPFVAQPMTFTYDAVGNRTVLKDARSGVTTSIYDAVNRLTSRQFGGTGQTPLRVDFTYTPRNQIATITRFSDLAGTVTVAYSAYSYDNAARLTNLQHQNSTGGILANYTYTFDQASRMTSQTVNGSTTSYSYDAASEVTADGATNYAYDLNGNRTGGSNQTGTANQLTSDGTWTYSYDNEGNLTKKTRGASADTWTYGYDNLNHMVWAQDSATDGGTVTTLATYVYDAFGNRLEKDVWTQSSGTTTVSRFAYDGKNVWADFNSGNHLQTRYLRGDMVDQLFARTSAAGAAAWYLTDWEGSVRNITDNSGNVQDTIAYDAFGNVTSESNSAAGDRYKYTGRELDAETGLQYNRARYYDATKGRWTSQDPLGFAAGDANLYRYVHNNATDRTDPLGLTPASTSQDIPIGPIRVPGNYQRISDLQKFALNNKDSAFRWAIAYRDITTRRFDTWARSLGVASSDKSNLFAKALWAEFQAGPFPKSGDVIGDFG
jgi:RHS repeat-associated protein